MNIKEAKEQIKNAMTAYFTKNEFGEYAIPIEKQRPVFLMGPPGIGKTAVMEQIASEMGVALVSYSMTHHTRQSALGLPFIEKKNYGGTEYSVSEYTMSEIIASVYDMKEKTGLKEGILFLDEINCVSETLAPSMLQFLQYKIFGRHRVPDGWIVVTAGNPPEYNNSVREFDIVTWDRLKRIDIEPDFDVWKEYAYKKAVHPAIITYLEIKRSDFYKIESTTDGKSFVTARGWSDLSDMLRLYEKNGINADKKLISQYLQNPAIAKNFAIYYDLFKKYRNDYQVDKILSGEAGESIRSRARDAKFDERLALLGLILDAIGEKAHEVADIETSQTEILNSIRTVRADFAKENGGFDRILQKKADTFKAKLKEGRMSSSLSDDGQRALHGAISALENMSETLIKEPPSDAQTAFAAVKKLFDARTAEIKKQADKTKKSLSNAFAFCEDVFGEGQELLILVTELTAGHYSSRFISRFGCEEYFKHNKELLFYERQKEIINELCDLTLE